MKIHALIIDPQNDFCDPNGSLYVKGAEQDMDRLASMVSRLHKKLNDIHVTLDSHRKFDVAHPVYWVNSSGNHPKPFTLISAHDVENGTWQPSVPALLKRSLEYVQQLEKAGRYQLCVWPEHCLIGSPGHNINSKLFAALQEWSERPGIVDMVTKGSNPFTEHYSAVQAEVPDPQDPSTQINTSLIKTLMEADEIVTAGEASSHCVANTLRDIANAFGDDSYVKKIVYLKDASSYVAGLPNDFGKTMEENFIREMTKRGMRVSTTKEYLT